MNLNRPSKSVTVPVVVPTIIMFADGTGPLLSLTYPLIPPDCGSMDTVNRIYKINNLMVFPFYRINTHRFEIIHYLISAA